MQWTDREQPTFAAWRNGSFSAFSRHLDRKNIMSDEPTKPPPDYARMYRDLDATDPKWRDKIEAQTGNRPGEPVTPKSPKDNLPTTKPGTPSVGQTNVPKPMPPGGIPPESLPKIPGVTQPATPGQGPGVKPTELPKPNQAGTLPKPASANPTTTKVGAPTASKVGEPVRPPAQPNRPKSIEAVKTAPPATWQGKEDARRATPPPTDAYKARERIKPQEEAKAKAVQASQPSAKPQPSQPKVVGPQTAKVVEQRKPTPPAPRPPAAGHPKPAPQRPPPPQPRPPAPTGRRR